MLLQPFGVVTTLLLFIPSFAQSRQETLKSTQHRQNLLRDFWPWKRARFFPWNHPLLPMQGEDWVHWVAPKTPKRKEVWMKSAKCCQPPWALEIEKWNVDFACGVWVIPVSRFLVGAFNFLSSSGPWNPLRDDYHLPPNWWSGISGGPMHLQGGSIRGRYPFRRDFPFGNPNMNLARTPMGQLGWVGGDMVWIHHRLKSA